MVTRLSKTDAMRLHSQNSTMPGHTVSVIIIEPSDQLSHERLHQLVGSSLPEVARFRSRLVGKPMGMGQPLWAQIDDYDPTSQIHSATICAPGGWREFANLVGQLITGPRDRPETLWEAWSIDGLAGGRWALVVRMSPALNGGGIGAASVCSRLLRSGPGDDPANDEPIEPSLGTPCLGELVTDAMTELLESYVKGLWFVAETVTGLLRAVHGRLSGTREPDPMPPAVSSMSGPVPASVFNAPLTERRAVAFASIPFADLAAVSHAFGGSVTNVFLAACTLSVRAWLERHDTVPDGPLLIQMPLPIPGDDPATLGNPLAIGRIRIPVQLDDPVQVLTNLHTATDRLNTARMHDAESAGPRLDLMGIASLMPTTVVHTGMRLYAALGARQWLTAGCHGSVSYVSGQPAPAYCAGSKVVSMHTVVPLREGCGLNITLTSRGDVMDVSVCVCPDNVPAVEDIATGIGESVDILVAAALKSPRGQGRSVVTQMTSHATKRSHARRY